ncbi:sensor domain-containing diguanylate cyclase [bacterium LRH843]|nr:sensor domain-containing diguanylate cyclase [bacterium LRH843]
MWIVIVGIITGLLLICTNLYYKNKKLQQQVRYLEPIIETVENVRDIIYYCETVPTLNYLYLSRTVNDLLGPSAWEEHIQNPEKIFEIVHPDDYEILMKKKLGQLNFYEPIIVRFMNHRGQYIWFEEYATPVYKSGELLAVKGVFRNIDEKMVLQQQLEYKTSHDGLTDLYNREYFQSKMENYDQNCEVPIAVIVADLDRLKFINDHYGHQMGDNLIRETASRFKTHANEEMVLARIGGDEFAILLANASVPQVEQYVQNVQVEMQLHSDDTPIFPIKISIGYAYSQSSKGVMEQLLSEADARMYKDKKAKKRSSLLWETNAHAQVE